MRLTTVILIALASAGGSLTGLRDLVTTQDLAAISSLKQHWEHGWEEGWHLSKAEFKDIDHFHPGIVLTWERQVGADQVTRLDAFDLDGSFYWGHETTSRDGLEVARGPIQLTADGQRTFRVVVHLGPKRVPVLGGLTTDQEILFYELHAFGQGTVRSVYRSKLNFTIGPDGPIIVPADAELVFGPPVPAVEQRRRTPP